MHIQGNLLMKKSILSVIAATLLLTGCDGVTEPPYPPSPDEDNDDPANPGEDGDDDTAFIPAGSAPQHIPVIFPAEPYQA